MDWLFSMYFVCVSCLEVLAQLNCVCSFTSHSNPSEATHILCIGIIINLFKVSCCCPAPRRKQKVPYLYTVSCFGIQRRAMNLTCYTFRLKTFFPFLILRILCVCMYVCAIFMHTYLHFHSVFACSGSGICLLLSNFLM